jgi:AcrR family transcriptional regulator
MMSTSDLPKASEEAPPSQTRTPGRRERRRAEVRERLFQAALTLFNERGFQATTVRAITEAADVGKGTFFNYFPTKEHFWVMYYEQQKRNFDEAQRAVDTGGTSVREAIKKLMWRMADRSTPALVRSFLQAIFSNQAVATIVMPQLYRNRQRFEELLKIGQKRGEVRRDKPPAELARALHEIGFGTALFWAFRGEVPLDTLLEANLDLVLNTDRGTIGAATGKRDVRKGRNGNPRKPRHAGTKGRTKAPTRR